MLSELFDRVELSTTARSLIRQHAPLSTVQTILSDWAESGIVEQRGILDVGAVDADGETEESSGLWVSSPSNTTCIRAGRDSRRIFKLDNAELWLQSTDPAYYPGYYND
jgi:hypothetical protein